MFDIPQLLGYV